MTTRTSTPSAAPATATGARRTARTVGRWLLTFTGFPLGGLAASLIVGPVDAPPAAVVGGLLSGAVLGAVQSWGLGPVGPATRNWVVATAVGLMVGLGIGAAVVDYGTTTADLALQGAICGLAVGAAQAVVLHRRIGRLSLAWPPFLAAVWALGWVITTAIGVQVTDQFTVFGSSGAVTVAALTTVLPLVLRHRAVQS